MHTHIGRRVFLVIGFSVMSLFLIPSFAEAQSSSSYRSKINKLDDDAVESLPIPILFGIDLSDLSANFGDPRGDGTRSHEGLDIMAPEGAPIVSPTEAVVVRTGSGGSSGKYVTTANPGGESFVYMHLSEITVKNGQVLEEGDLIGLVGNTGNASGGAPHLHFEIRKSRKALDPYLRIKEEFTLKEKVSFLDDILDDVDDEDEFVAFLMNEYAPFFADVKKAGLTLPKEFKSTTGSGVPVRTLKLGSSGADVSALQRILMADGYLDIEAPTNYFGAMTEKALLAFQKANKIKPANGEYGENTRTFLTKRTPVTTDMTLAELIKKVEELQKLLAELEKTT